MIRRLISIGAGIVVGLCLCNTLLAEPVSPAVDGRMVRVNASHLWMAIPLNSLHISAAEVIARDSDDVHFPAISPDGDQVIMYRPGDPGEPNRLYLWTQQDAQMREISAGKELSGFVSWQDNQTYWVREHSRPFFRNGAQQVFDIRPKASSRLRKLRPIADNRLVAYDADDIIVLENAANQTLQAISDSRLDRYFAPVISPDQKYVVFTGLTTGIHLFDIEKNTVVYVGSSGTNPAFSPDGRYLIYAQTTDNGHNYISGDLVIIDLLKHTSRLVANPKHDIRLYGSLSKDAKYLVFETENGAIYRAKIGE